MNKVARMRNNRKVWPIICALLIISLFIPTPYYIFQPGSVEELESKVTVEGGEKNAAGNLYLTTVFSLKASNVYYLAYGYFAPHSDIRKVDEVRGDMTDEEYSKLLDHMMTLSQQYALVAGLRAAGDQVNVQTNGIFVRSVLDTSYAAGKIKIGDVITQVDGHPVQESDDFLDYLADKHPEDAVMLTYVRNGKEYTADVQLIELDNGVNLAGVGIVPEDQFKVETERKVDINAADIGGPSAGLMFSLEIFNQMTEEDITKGYEIAGTGTIDLDGNVGQIGGIREKITAVNREGIDIFFCPADIHPHDSNEKDVLDEVKKEGYEVKVVPVKTLQEAVDYLEKLPPKQ